MNYAKDPTPWLRRWSILAEQENSPYEDAQGEWMRAAEAIVEIDGIRMVVAALEAQIRRIREQPIHKVGNGEWSSMNTYPRTGEIFHLLSENGIIDIGVHSRGELSTEYGNGDYIGWKPISIQSCCAATD